MEVLIRSAVLEDAGALARVEVDSKIVAYRPLLGEDFLADEPVAQRAQLWRQIISHDPSVTGVADEVLVAEAEDGVAGYAGIGPSRDEDGGGTGEVLVIYVHPDRWRSGAGRALLTAACRRLAERGFAGASLWVLEKNQRARAFYDRGGWAHDGTTKPAGRGLTFMRYCRPLKGPE